MLRSHLNIKILKYVCIKVEVKQFPNSNMFEVPWNNVVLFCGSLAAGALLVLALQMVKMFINSKPPGRRIVTADVHVLHATSFQLLITVFTLGHMLAALTKVGYWTTFIWIDAVTLTFVLYVSVGNVSSSLQIKVANDFE